MASTWGGSWGASWGNSWGSIARGGATALGDPADPQFYAWWSKRAKDERAKLEIVQEIIEAAAPALRVETIAAVEAATSVDEIQSLDLLKYERGILKSAIADYQRMIDEDEEEAAILLLMH